VIFVTTGTQLPFPRLCQAADDLAAELGEEVIVQTGQTAFPMEHATATNSLEPKEFDEMATRARVIIAHAGIGSILDAARFGKPLIIVPRRHALGEHRNDHQMATARRLASAIGGLQVAWEVEDLSTLVEQANQPVSNTRTGQRTALQRYLKTEIEDRFALKRSFLACLLGSNLRRTGSQTRPRSAAARL
jgi:UDP-N-acetylglucosamine transferase subunit ALG13